MHFGLERPKIDYRETYSQLADVFLLFSNSTPWSIVHSLGRGRMTLSEISKKLKRTPKAIIPDLAAMQSKKMLVSFCKSRKIYYRLADDRILQPFNLIHKISRKKAKLGESGGFACKACRISRKQRA